jgi:hypothetical protein
MRRLVIFALCVAATLCGTVLATASTPVWAQSTTSTTCPSGPPDPYSGGEANCQENRDVQLNVEIRFGPPGSLIRIRATGFVLGARVDITFGGELLRRTTAGQQQQGQQGLGRSRLATVRPDRLVAAILGRTTVRPQSAVGSIDETVAVPKVAPGVYDLCVISPGSKTTCVPFRVTAETSVLGSNQTRETQGTQGTKVLGVQFARTGLMLVPLVLAALAAIVIGLRLRSHGRRRRPA